MDKLLTFSSRTSQGVFAYVLGKDTNHLIKTAAEFHPQIAQYIREAKPIPGKTQLLLTALGAGEIWGQNANGDYFPREALAYEGKDYGYQTFTEHAKLYKHHINKDPKRSFGDVALSVYNPTYHRVELIITVNHSTAPEIVEKIDNGEAVDFSMGCRVPWDECNVCGHRAKTQKEYCEHAKYYLGRIHPGTGKLVYVINRFPKFFDISYVTIGADRIAKGLLKVAHTNAPTISSAELAEKSATISKESSIDKEIPATGAPSSQTKIEDAVRAIAEVKAHEPEMDKDLLDNMATGFPLSKIMTTLSALGILPKPQEFQRILLVNHGERKLADELYQKNICFDPSMCDEPNSQTMQYLDMSPRNFSEDLMRMVGHIVPSRSYAAPHLLKRIVIIEKTAAHNNFKFPIFYDSGKHDIDARPKAGIMPIMLLASGLYAALSKKAPELAATGLGELLAKHPGLAATLASSIPLVFNNMLGDHGKGNYVEGLEPEIEHAANKIERARNQPFAKLASGNVKASLGRIMIGVPAAYMASGILQKHKNLNPEMEEGTIRKFIRKNPDIIGGMVAVDGLMSATGGGSHGLFQKMFKHASVEDYVTNAVTWPLAFGSKAITGRMLGGFMDQALIEGSKKLLSKKQSNDKIK
jgi:hypothetical protein